jgi:hypothetical protein
MEASPADGIVILTAIVKSVSEQTWAPEDTVRRMVSCTGSGYGEDGEDVSDGEPAASCSTLLRATLQQGWSVTRSVDFACYKERSEAGNVRKYVRAVASRANG